MKDRNVWLAVAVLFIIWGFTAYDSSVQFTNDKRRIHELCDLCNQLTIENVEMKIKLKELEKQWLPGK